MAENRNPYAPPVAPVADPNERLADGEGIFIPNGRGVQIQRGVGWISDAWKLYRARPGKWLLNLVFFILIYVVASWIPFGNFLNSLLWPFIGAGVIMCADTQRREGTFAPDVFFAGLRKPGPLLVLALMFLLTVVALFVSFVIVMGVDVASQYVLNTRERTPTLPAGFGLAMLLYAVLAIPITAATYLAPPLIMLHDLSPGTAMKMSFIGSFKNILPGIVFVISSILFVLVSMIPLLLGLLISIPVMMITSYTVYRDIFIETR